MAAGHQQRTERHRPLRAQHAVGQHAAEDWGEIDETAVPAVDQRREGLVGHRPAPFHQRAKGAEADDVGGMIGQQELLDHVQRQ